MSHLGLIQSVVIVCWLTFGWCSARADGVNLLGEGAATTSAAPSVSPSPSANSAATAGAAAGAALAKLDVPNCAVWCALSEYDICRIANMLKPTLDRAVWDPQFRAQLEDMMESMDDGVQISNEQIQQAVDFFMAALDKYAENRAATHAADGTPEREVIPLKIFFYYPGYQLEAVARSYIKGVVDQIFISSAPGIRPRAIARRQRRRARWASGQGLIGRIYNGIVNPIIARVVAKYHPIAVERINKEIASHTERYHLKKGQIVVRPYAPTDFRDCRGEMRFYVGNDVRLRYSSASLADDFYHVGVTIDDLIAKAKEKLKERKVADAPAAPRATIP